MDKKITDSIIYIGVDDKDIDLFESQYVVPNGVSYNSYVIMDDKIAIMDTADARVTDKWFANLREALGDRKPDYLVVSHLEPDHASNIQKVAEAYPDMQIVGNAKTFNMMGQFFDIDLTDRKVVVAEGDKLSLGKHELTFVMAPMVHWPEVMMSTSQQTRCFSQQTALVSLVRLILMRTGHVRQDAITSILLESMVPRYRQFSKRQQGLTLKRFVLFTDRFSQRTLAST